MKPAKLISAIFFLQAVAVLPGVGVAADNGVLTKFVKSAETTAPPPARAVRAGAAWGHADDALSAALTSTYESAHFVFRFAEEEDGLRGFFDNLEKNHARIAGFYGITPSENMLVEIYPDIKTYHRRTFGENSQDWAVGNFDPDDNVIRITSPNNPGKVHDRAGILQTSVHEFTHAMTAEFRRGAEDSLPGWLSEGLALYFEGPLHKSSRRRIHEAASAGKLPSISDLSADFMNKGGYDYAGTIVEFLLAKYGEAKVRGFVLQPGSWEKSFSSSAEKINAAWHRYLKKAYR